MASSLFKFDQRPRVFKSIYHEIIVIILVCMAQFLSQAGVTMSLSTMNIMLNSFQVTDKTIQVWFMGGYSLSVGTFILFSGKLGDLFGLKKIFIVGWIWVSLWSLITGISYYSKSIIFFIICRAFQGVGYALLLPCGMGILGHIYPNGKRKNLAFGCIGANGPIGAMVGAFMAAVVGQTWWWPWEFYLITILSIILLIGSIFFIPHLSNDEINGEITIKNVWQKLDIFGALTGIIGLILLNFIWNQGPVAGWGKAYIIVVLIISILLIVSFFIIELNFSTHPLLPRSIFNIKVGLILACISFGWGSFGIWQYYYWNIILNLRLYTAIEGGLTYTPFLVMGTIAAITVSFIIIHTKPSYIISFATTCFMVGCIMLSVMPVEQSYFRISMGQMFILCWGMDLSFPAASIILSDILPQHHQGMAGSLVTTMVNYSVSLFLGISSCVEIEIFKHNQDQLGSYRAGLYFGIGVAAIGVICSFVLIFLTKDDLNGNEDLVEEVEHKHEEIEVRNYEINDESDEKEEIR
ncbi:unnamed protein product [Candida verbasci]|uniref:Major facilitator superfamily (MFS) profile domain-containing protein n=1 Tax=Candida verbasci TaxID=1227364 RepID=A0A9W4TWV0_9ASCO|nr:unnamed protein product [Candida verbasci]